MDYTVVPLSTGILTIVEKSGVESVNEIAVGIPYFRYAGAEHNVINRSDIEVAFMEIEIK